MTKIKQTAKWLDYWLHFFGFRKRESSLKEKMCEATKDLCAKYKQEAKEATRELRMKHEKQVV